MRGRRLSLSRRSVISVFFKNAFMPSRLPEGAPACPLFPGSPANIIMREEMASIRHEYALKSKADDAEAQRQHQAAQADQDRQLQQQQAAQQPEPEAAAPAQTAVPQ